MHRNSDLSVSDYGVAIGRFVGTHSQDASRLGRLPLIEFTDTEYLAKGYLPSARSRAAISLAIAAALAVAS